MIQFNCKNCNEPLEVPDSLAGDMLQCPQCRLSQWIPGGRAKIKDCIVVTHAEKTDAPGPLHHKSDPELWISLWAAGSLFLCGVPAGGGSDAVGCALLFGCLMLLGIFISMGCLMAWSAKQANILERIAHTLQKDPANQKDHENEIRR